MYGNIRIKNKQRNTMKDYKQLRQETINAINAFHQCYPNNKESEMDIMDYSDMRFCGTTETQQ